MKFLAALLCLLLAFSPALAEFDAAPLREDPDLIPMPQFGTANTAYRPSHQPYIGQVDEPFEGDLVAFVDYITLADEGVTLLRLSLSTMVFGHALYADEMRLTVGGRQYTFAVSAAVDEYDGLYMEDYAVCLTDASLPLLAAIARQKTDEPIPVALFSLGEAVLTGLVVIPGADAAELYDRFVDLGGKKQGLKALDERWPCTVENVK